MKRFRLFLFSSVAVAVGGAWAQTPLAQTAANDAALEQRRADLRSLLKAPRGWETAQRDQALENVSPNRHLSARELADLREQLRQQRRDSRLERP